MSFFRLLTPKQSIVHRTSLRQNDVVIHEGYVPFAVKVGLHSWQFRAWFLQEPCLGLVLKNFVQVPLLKVVDDWDVVDIAFVIRQEFVIIPFTSSLWVPRPTHVTRYPFRVSRGEMQLACQLTLNNILFVVWGLVGWGGRLRSMRMRSDTVPIEMGKNVCLVIMIYFFADQ